MDHHLDVATVEMPAHGLLVMGHSDPLGRHRGAAVDDLDQVGVEGDAGAPQLAHDAAPVRIGPEERALHQLALGDLAGAPPRLLRRPGAFDPHPDDLRCALGVLGHLRRQVCARLTQGVVEQSEVANRSATPTGQDDDNTPTEQ